MIHLLFAGLRYRVSRRGWEVLVGFRWFPVHEPPSFPPGSYAVVKPEVEVALDP